MPAPISVQLYSVRDICKDDYAGTMKRIADMGYIGVEPAGFPGSTVDAAGRIYADLGLQVSSAHLPLPVGDAASESIDTAGKLGITRVISGLGPDRFATTDGVKASCETFNAAAQNARAAGTTFGIHNHWWEFGELDGRLVYKHMLELLDPDVFFQVDCYWVKTAGREPAEIVAELGPRAPLLHIKDGPCDRELAMTAVGDGIIDWAPVVAAGADHTEWLVVELDRCDTDMIEAVAKSYDYLVGNGLAQGKR